MSREPNAFDKLLARILCGELPLEFILGAVALASCVGSTKLAEHEYLRECLVELSVGSAFFLAIYLVEVEKLTVAVAISLFIVGGLLGVTGFLVAPSMPLLATYLLKLASAVVLFVLIEQIIRGILIRAAESRGGWEKTVQAKRQAAVAKARKAGKAAAETAGDTAAIGVIAVAGILLKATGNEIKVAYEDEDGNRLSMEGPNIPEPLFDAAAFDIPWSLTGIFRRSADDDNPDSSS